MRVVEVNSIDGLPGLRLVWRSLLNETAGASFHQSCEWFEAVCRRQASNSRLRVLLVTGDGETVGILPLVQMTRATRLGTERVIGYLRDRCSPFQFPIGPQPTATLMAGLRYLSNHDHSWDVLEFRDVNSAAADYQRTCTALQVAGWRFREGDEPTYPVIELPGKPAACSAALPNFSTPDRMTFARHRPGGAMVNDANPHWDLFEQCLELHHDDDPSSSTSRELIRDIHAAASRCGAADLNLLRRDNQLVACCYNVHLDGVLLNIFSGGAADGENHTVMTTFVSKMLGDSVTRRDRLWIPRPGLSCAHWPSSLRHRKRLVHDHRRGVRPVMRRLGRLVARVTK